MRMKCKCGEDVELIEWRMPGETLSLTATLQDMYVPKHHTGGNGLRCDYSGSHPSQLHPQNTGGPDFMPLDTPRLFEPASPQPQAV